MAKNFLQHGDVMSYTNNTAAAIVSDEVVIIGGNGGALVSVALSDIPVGGTGSVALEGVFTVPKLAGAVIAQGEPVMYDASLGVFDDSLAVPAVGDVTGNAFAFNSAGAGTTVVEVNLTGIAGVLH